MLIFFVKENRLYISDYNVNTDGIISLQNFIYDKQKFFPLFHIPNNTYTSQNISYNFDNNLTHIQKVFLYKSDVMNILYIKFNNPITEIYIYINRKSENNLLYSNSNIKSMNIYIENIRLDTDYLNNIDLIIEYKDILNKRYEIKLSGKYLLMNIIKYKSLYDNITIEWSYFYVSNMILDSLIDTIGQTHPKYTFKYKDTQYIYDDFIKSNINISVSVNTIYIKPVMIIKDIYENTLQKEYNIPNTSSNKMLYVNINYNT